MQVGLSVLAEIKEVNKLDYWVHLCNYHLIYAHMDMWRESARKQCCHVLYHEYFNSYVCLWVSTLSGFFRSFTPFGVNIMILYLMQRCHRLDTREGAQGWRILPSAAAAAVSKLNTLLALAPLINKTSSLHQGGVGAASLPQSHFPWTHRGCCASRLTPQSTNTVTQELVSLPLALLY